MTTLATLPALLAVALSISSADDYHYVSIPTNMAVSLTGVGMGSEASAEDAPLRYEDAAFLAEAYAERWNAFGSSSVGNRSVDIAEVVKASYYENAKQFAFDGIDPFYFYAQPEAVAFSGEVKAIPYVNTTSNFWCSLFSSDAPAITSKGDLPFLFDGFGKGSPLRKSDIASLYEALGKMSRPCFYTANELIPVDKTYHEAFTDVDNASSWIRGYSSSFYEFTYGTDYATNYVETTANANNFEMSIKATFTAARQKYVGMVGNTKYTEITAGHRTSTDIVKKNYTDTMLLLDTRPMFAKLGQRRIKDASLFVVGKYNRLLYDENNMEDKFRDSQYFLARVDVEPVTAAPGTILNDVTLRKDELDALAKKVTALYGGTFYESADALLSDVPTPDDPTCEDSDHNERTSELKFIWEILIRGFLVVLDVDFNARVTDGNE